MFSLERVRWLTRLLYYSTLLQVSQFLKLSHFRSTSTAVYLNQQARPPPSPSVSGPLTAVRRYYQVSSIHTAAQVMIVSLRRLAEGLHPPARIMHVHVVTWCVFIELRSCSVSGLEGGLHSSHSLPESCSTDGYTCTGLVSQYHTQSRVTCDL